MIPACYEAYRQEERRQLAWDRTLERLPGCCVCGHKIFTGEWVHRARGRCVCAGCMEELAENVGRV